jgi:hypothetical protein
MHQPLTIVKVRKEITVKVPAGGWVLLVSPDQPFGDHVAKRREIFEKGLVNEDIEIVAVGRMDNKFADLKLITKAEEDAAKKVAAQTEKDLAKSNEDARARQKRLEDDAAKREREAHDKQVAEISKENDAIRTRFADAKPK